MGTDALTLIEALDNARYACELAAGAARAGDAAIALDLASGALVKLQAAVEVARFAYEASRDE
jgi:hypothetical protein